jgi:hypothetical protein
LIKYAVVVWFCVAMSGCEHFDDGPATPLIILAHSRQQPELPETGRLVVLQAFSGADASNVDVKIESAVGTFAISDSANRYQRMACVNVPNGMTRYLLVKSFRSECTLLATLHAGNSGCSGAPLDSRALIVSTLVPIDEDAGIVGYTSEIDAGGSDGGVLDSGVEDGGLGGDS